MIILPVSAKCLSLAVMLPSVFGSIRGVAAYTRRAFPNRDTVANVEPSYKTASNNDPACPDPYQASNVFKSVAYFTNWGVYNTTNYKPKDLPIDRLTHLNYAFAMVDPKNGSVLLNDPWADVQMPYPKDPPVSGNDTDLKGTLKQIGLLKKTNRQMKVLLSVGGYNGSPNMSRGLSTPQGINNFVTSAVKLVEDLGLDGLDLDWEFFDFEGEDISANAANYVTAVQQLRTTLDRAAAVATNGTAKMLLTIACPAAPKNAAMLHLATMDPFIDFWNLMAYDFAGNWSSVTGHAANLYLGASNSTTSSTPFSANEGVNYYLSQKIPASKIVLGMPLYGRAFSGTTGIGKKYKELAKGQKPDQPGYWDYKHLPRPGAKKFYDDDLGAAWTYDNATATMVTYDSQEVAVKKAEYICGAMLGGAMWWSADGDVKGELSLIKIVSDSLKTMGMQSDGCQNRLKYPKSKYANVRNGLVDK